jgi:Tfp pilus tip-associated adhesin PilY1
MVDGVIGRQLTTTSASAANAARSSVSPTWSTNGGPLRRLQHRFAAQPLHWSEVANLGPNPGHAVLRGDRETEAPREGSGERHDVLGDFRRSELLAIGEQHLAASELWHRQVALDAGSTDLDPPEL